MTRDYLEGETLGQRIKRLRKERNMSQTDLRKLINVTISWISTIEADKSSPSPDLLNKMAAAFKVPIRELLHNEDEYMETVSRMKLAEVLLETNQPVEAKELINRIEGKSDLSDDDRRKIALLSAESEYQQKYFAQSLTILNPLIHSLEAENHPDAHLQASVRNLIGSCYFQLQDFTNAHYNYRKAYDLTTRFVEFDLLSAKIAYNVALSLLKFENCQESLYFLDKASSYYRKCNDLRKLADTIVTQGLAYQNLKLHEQAIDTFNQAKGLLEALNLQSLYALVEHTIATEIIYHNNPELALGKLQNCIPLLEKTNHFGRLIIVHSKIASIHLKGDDTDHAFKHLSIASQIVDDHNFGKTAESAVCYRELSKYYLLTQNLDKCIEFSLKSSELFATMGLIKDQAHSLQVCIKAHQKSGDIASAFQVAQECNWLLLENGQGSV